MNGWIKVPVIAGLIAVCGLNAVLAAQRERTIVYAMDNNPTANHVFAWQAPSNGTLSRVGVFATGGRGTGTAETPGAGPVDGIDPLGSQGSLTLSPNGRLLFAVNTGSGSVSVMRVLGNGGLHVLDRRPTGGTSPVSVAVWGPWVYVVNVNDPANGNPSTIMGFMLHSNGRLSPITRSLRGLSAPNARPSQISVTPDGTQVVVTERETNVVSVFQITRSGVLSAPVTTPSPRPAPFGFAFAGASTMVVSEAAPMDPAGASSSSYDLVAAGTGGAKTASLISAGVLNGQMASCWTTVSPNGTRAYVSNTASDTVTICDIGSDGTLTLDEAAVPTGGAGSAPIDAGINSSGSMFFQLLGGKGTIALYSVASNGDLSLLGVRPTGLPMLGTQGLTVLR